MSDRQELAGWSMYAWANHAWETTVSTVLIGPWLLALATHHRADSSTLIQVGSLHLRADSYPSLIVTVAAFGQLCVLPFVGAAADRRGNHRRWLSGACVIGASVAGLLATLSGGEYALAGALVFVGSIVYAVSDVIYNSYLPRLAKSVGAESLSSRGFAYGYLGGGLLLAANLALLVLHGRLGFSKLTAVRICFISAGLWWAGFGLPAIRKFGGRSPNSDLTATNARKPGVLAALRTILGLPHTRRYLLAYLLFSDAISAVISLSSTFITHELFHSSATKAATFLFSLILLIQFVALAGSLAFGRLAQRTGAKPAMLFSLTVWVAVILYTYAGLHTKTEAVAAGVVIGLVLGGSQALARALWSQMTPAGQEATFFGFFGLSTKGTSWIAPLLFTIVVNATGSYRQAILSLLVLLIAGAVLLAATDINGAITEATSAQFRG
jgi:MFS transporter, UMF1 family